VAEATTRVSAAPFDAVILATHGRHCLLRPLEHTHAPPQLATRRGKRGDLVVGDHVRCTPSGEDAVVEAVLPRRSLLYRADAWRTKELAANVDLVVVVFAPQPVFNRWFIWRALVAARCAELDCLVVLNKTDLCAGSADPADITRGQLEQLGYATEALAARTQPAGTRERLLARLAGRVTLLIGQSGMGKSTLLNLLVPSAQAATREFSARLNLGKQTTTTTRWFDLPEPAGGALIDSPGFQEFGLAHLTRERMAAALPEFQPHLGHCRFADCRHLEEPGCAIRAAVDQGEIDPDRYAFYRALVPEAAATS
jgi:ribosome biogenesis GTPase